MRVTFRLSAPDSSHCARLIVPFLLAGIAVAAQEQPAPSVETNVSAASAASAPARTGPDRHIFGVLPNYRTAPDAGDIQPLTWRQKFNIARHDSFDPPGYAIAAWYTAIYHLENTNPEFGQGIKGYAHRYATTYADQMVGNMMTEGLMPSLLREDPRYYRRAYGSIPLRSAYAVSRLFVTRTDAKTLRFNFSELSGNAISAGIAGAYYPSERKPGDMVRRLATQFMSDGISNGLKEFWPDIKRRFHLGPRHRRREP